MFHFISHPSTDDVLKSLRSFNFDLRQLQTFNPITFLFFRSFCPLENKLFSGAYLASVL